MEQLDALLTEPTNDEEFEALWSQVMTIVPPRPDLFPATADQPPTAPPPAADPHGLPRTTRDATTKRPKRRGVSVREPSHGLIEEAKRTGPRQCLVRTATAPRKDAPVIGVRIQRSSATNARKLAALLAEPPARPGMRRPPSSLPASRKTATPARPTPPAVAPTAPPADATKPERPEQRGKASLVDLFGDTLSNLEEESTSTPAPNPHGQPPTTPARLSVKAAEPATAQPVAAAPARAPRTPPATPAIVPSTRDTPPFIPVRVREDLIIHVPYHAARISRVYKVRLATRRYTLRFDRAGRCHYVREFPA
ncbi:vegetative cell wall protein gp1-like [Solenopsis invicta]|uniref:vegetative cell wall protein gp1-like n=1 Tax=Solenopsis invicta TaxID=13686 RepID=UPI0005961A00|nr:vegetative cell wall protein gp1-like [Solenopsis invicta]